MYDAGKIITGLIIAIVLLTFPVWFNFGKELPPAPDPKLTAKAEAAKTCIYPKPFMVTNHMQILDEWRNKVVRDGFRFVTVEAMASTERPEMMAIGEVRNQLDASVVEIPGFGHVRQWVNVDSDALLVQVSAAHKQYEMSLQNTCMDCHSNKKQFCDQCHNYADVSPFCWDCHVEPKE